MNRKTGITTAVVSTVLALAAAGCSSSSESSDTGAADPTPVVGTQTPPKPDEIKSMAGDRAELYESLPQLVDDSSIIVIATVTGQPGPLDKYPLPSTISEIQVIETLRGTPAPGDTLKTIDLATPEVAIMEEAAGVPNLGQTYLFFLNTITHFDGIDGIRVDASDVYSSPIPVHFAVNGDTFAMDYLETSDTMPTSFTRAELLAAMS